MTRQPCEHCGEPLTGLDTDRFCMRSRCRHERRQDANRRHRERELTRERDRRNHEEYRGNIKLGKIWTLDRIIHASD